MTFLRFIYIVSVSVTYSHFVAQHEFIVWRAHILFIHSALHGHVYSLQCEVITDNAAINICIKLISRHRLSLLVGSGIVGSYGQLTFDVLRNCHPVFQSGSTLLSSN